MWIVCRKRLKRLVTLLEKKVLADLNMYNKLVEEIILGQEDQPGTHSTGAEIAH